MKKLIVLVNDLQNSAIKEIIDKRMLEFEEFGRQTSQEIFKELCFCFLTANFSAEEGIRIQNEINNGFLHLSEGQLAKLLKELGHRFPNARAKFIYNSRIHKDNLKNILESLGNEIAIREWIVNHIKGIGMKEASHFLRNIGYKNIAIIDFHILDLLERQGLIEKPKSMTPNKYIEIENILKKLADKTGISLGELDLYLWYHETGKVLK